MIDNPAAFITFAQTWFDSEKHIKGFAVWLYTTHGYAKDGSSIAEDEKAFLNALQAPPVNGAGLKLFRGNAAMNNFTPIKVSSTGQVVANPCN